VKAEGVGFEPTQRHTSAGRRVATGHLSKLGHPSSKNVVGTEGIEPSGHSVQWIYSPPRLHSRLRSHWRRVKESNPRRRSLVAPVFGTGCRPTQRHPPEMRKAPAALSPGGPLVQRGFRLIVYTTTPPTNVDEE